MKVWASTSGNQQVSQVNTGYIRCTGGALAAPPFKLHKRGIVYCEQMRSHSLKCLTRVVFRSTPLSDQLVDSDASWTLGEKAKTQPPENTTGRISHIGCEPSSDIQKTHAPTPPGEHHGANLPHWLRAF